MNTREISVEEANALVVRDESHIYEKKPFSASGRILQKIAVAFANADGGEFVVGIADAKNETDPTKRWQGGTDYEALNGHLQALFEIQPSLDLRYEFLKMVDKDGYVLRVTVEKGSEVHKTSDQTVYRRHGAQSLPIKDPQKIAELSFAKGSHSYEDKVLPTVLPEQVVEAPELKSFLTDYSPKTDPLDFILNQNMVDPTTWEPRVASVLLFHPSPSSVIPRKCAIKITRYETKEDDPERDHLASQATIEGPCFSLIHEAIEKVSKIMSSVQVWTTDGLKSLEYPPEAIWEVLVNAVIHRDYSISDDIQVLIFDNRIEIKSPGKLPGYVTVKNILEARFSRNSKIVRTLNRYRNAPNKDLGEGLNTTFQKMKEWGLKSPEILEEGNYVTVILPHAPLAAPTEAILQFLTNHKQITNSQARDLTGIKSENLVKVEFYKLRDEKLIERVPELKGRKSAWHLTAMGSKHVKNNS